MELLRKNRVGIVKHMCDISEILDMLFSKYVMSQEMMETIQAKEIRQDKVRELLNYITCKSNGYSELIQALYETGNDYVLELLHEETSTKQNWTKENFEKLLLKGKVPNYMTMVNRDDKVKEIRDALRLRWEAKEDDKVKKDKEKKEREKKEKERDKDKDNEIKPEKNADEEASSFPLKMRIVCLYGMGGSGKTYLASSATRDLDLIRTCFNDGIVWNNVGHTRDMVKHQLDAEILGIMRTIVSYFDSDMKNGFLSQIEARDRLNNLLREKDFLLILDDVWNKEILQEFNGLPMTILITSRQLVLVKGLEEQSAITTTHAMKCVKEAEAIVLKYSEHQPHEMPRNVMDDILRRCNGLPLALKTLGSILKGRKEEAMRQIMKSFSEAGFSAHDTDEYKILYEILMVSIEQLEKEEPVTANRLSLLYLYLDIAAIRDDQKLTASTLKVVWSESKEAEIELRLDVFANRGLLDKNKPESPSKDATTTTYSIHDVQLFCIQTYVQKEERSLDSRHDRWIDGYMKQKNSKKLINCIIKSFSEHDAKSSSGRLPFTVDQIFYHVEKLELPTEKVTINFKAFLVDDMHQWIKMTDHIQGEYNTKVEVVIQFLETLRRVLQARDRRFHRSHDDDEEMSSDLRKKCHLPLLSKDEAFLFNEVIEMLLIAYRNGWVSCFDRLTETVKNAPSKNTKKEVIVALLNTKDKDGRCPLHLGALKGNLEGCKLLLDHGAEINLQDSYSWTSLHNAATRGHVTVVEMLLSRDPRSDINAIGYRKTTPLHLAAANGHKGAVDVLIRHKAEVDLQDEDMQTPLHMAALYGNIENVTALLDAKADSSLKDSQMKTAVHLAATNGHKRVLQLLIDRGASVNSVDREGRNPLDYALRCQDRDVFDYLLSRGGDVDTPDRWNMTPQQLLTWQVNNNVNEH